MLLRTKRPQLFALLNPRWELVDGDRRWEVFETDLDPYAVVGLGYTLYWTHAEWRMAKIREEWEVVGCFKQWDVYALILRRRNDDER